MAKVDPRIISIENITMLGKIENFSVAEKAALPKYKGKAIIGSSKHVNFDSDTSHEILQLEDNSTVNIVNGVEV